MLIRKYRFGAAGYCLVVEHISGIHETLGLITNMKEGKEARGEVIVGGGRGASGRESKGERGEKIASDICVLFTLLS